MNEQTIHKIWEFAERVQPVYELLEWELVGKGIPTVEDIAELTKEKVMKVMEDKNCLRASSGGIYAEREPEDGVISFGLEISGGYHFIP